jgi:hypothetical protein
MMFRKVSSIAILVGLIASGYFCPILAETPPTNEQMVVNTVSRSIKTLIDSLQLVPSNVLIEKVNGLNGLVINGVRSAFIDAGWTVLNQYEKNPDFIVDADLTSFEFNYRKGKSRGFFNKPFIQRELTGQILLNVTDDRYDYVGFVEFSGGDEVLPEQANYIASVRYKQLAPEMPGTGVMRYLEPIAVTATIGGLIYLFFINR